MYPSSSHLQTIPLQMTSSTKFGRYEKISVEQSWNMIESDGFMVPFAGYKNVITISPRGVGRGIFYSSRSNNLFLIIDDGLYIVNPDLTYSKVQEIETSNGDIFMDENEKKEIGICDLKNIYIYNYETNTLSTAVLDFEPGYISYQDGRFLTVDLNAPVWRLSDETISSDFPFDEGHVGLFQTKPDVPTAVFRLPGKGNFIFVMGNTVTEQWTDTGINAFPYQRNQSFNIDYGCISSDTIAFSDNYIAWLAANEKSGPVIMVSDGGSIQQISNDGINFKFAQLTEPEDSYGFFFKQDGHLFYVITFTTDNLTYAFDFETKKFYTLSDQNLNHHIAKKIAFFNNSYYFISTIDGNLYELSSNYTNYDYGLNEEGEIQLYEIPRIIIPPTIRKPDTSPFIANNLNFIIEEGTDPYYTGQVVAPDFPNEVRKPRVDLNISTDGGYTFGNTVSYELNSFGSRRNLINFWRLGRSNEFVPQFKFFGFGRFVVGNGTVSVTK